MAAPRAVKELRDIPFGYLIGEPLKAAIEAQAIAAKTTIDFIEKVGFLPHKVNNIPVRDSMLFADEDADAIAGEVRNVKFTYKKRDENNVESSFELSVPILSIVPIPILRVDEVMIDFTAKLTDVVENASKENFQLSAQADGNYKSWWSPVALEFRTAMSYESSKTSSSRYTRDYTMSIHVRAVQDDMPAGLSKILDILESTIKEQKK
jgi:hypothetical protein